MRKVSIYIVAVTNKNLNSVGGCLIMEKSPSPFLLLDNGVSIVGYFGYDRHVFVRVLEKFELFSGLVKCLFDLNVYGV